MMRHPRLMLSSLIVLAIALTFFKIPLASSQSLTLLAVHVDGDLPLADPDSVLWKRSTAIDVPLSAQTISLPRLNNTNVKAVTARALRNDQQVAILVEWADTTENASTVRVQDFRDAVAVQFPLVEGEPFICMGQADGNVNVWHWKADWQADLAARQDMETVYPNINVDQYPFAKTAFPAPADYADPNYVPAFAAGNSFAAVHTSPVENLIAGGFGSLTTLPPDDQPVQGHGVYADGKWRVIFSRDLTALSSDDAKFEAGKIYPMAIAAWDGANNERNGQKSVSAWIALSVSRTPTAKPEAVVPSAPPIDLGLLSILLLSIVAIITAIGLMIGWRVEQKHW